MAPSPGSEWYPDEKDHSPKAAAARDEVRRDRHHQVCQRCGQVHFGCKAHKRRSRPLEPCGRWPSRGQQVCSNHGGKTGTALAAAKVRLDAQKEMEKMERAVRTFGLPVKTDPQQALLDEIYRTAGHVKWLGDQIAELSPEELAWNKTAEEHQTGVGMMGDPVDMTSTTMSAKPTVLVELYQKERAHLVHVCKVAIQCGIAERQVRIAEEQGQMIAGLLRSVFEAEELQLTAVQLTAARNVASRALRQLQLRSASTAESRRPPLTVVGRLPEKSPPPD